jgi:processive 1,2-diacylglycerol beta-glucosyltransferase
VPQVRILVLTSSTGGGHDMRAQAFAQWVFRIYKHAVDVRIENVLERSSVVGKSGVGLYNWIQRRAPWLHHPYYVLIEGLGILNRRTVTFGRNYYIDLLQEYQPHLVFSVHDCLNRGYFQLARSILGGKVKCVTYCGEFSGGYGYSRNWVDESVDMFYARTPTARDYAIKLGLTLQQTSVRGHLMAPRAHFDLFTPERREEFLVTKLGLRPDRLTILLATGGNGANNHMELLPVLAQFHERVQAIVVCGTNKQTFAEAIHWRTLNPRFSCAIEGYSHEMHRLMQASDAIVTRGGTTTCAKALHFRCPIIFNGFGGIMPQEKLTVKYFDHGGGIEQIARADDLRKILARWTTDFSAYPALKAAFEALRYEEDPRLLIRELVGFAAGVAGVPALPEYEEH